MTKLEYLKKTLREIAPKLNFNLIDLLIDQIAEEIESHVDYFFPAETPTITPVITGEGDDEVVTIVMSTATEGAVIYYTVNGRTPTSDSPIYTGPILHEGEDSITYTAMAVKRWFDDSDIAVLVYPSNETD